MIASTDPAVSVGLFFLLLIAYFVPTCVALLRGHRNGAAIGVLNIFLGWTLLGWVIALVWACMADDSRRDVSSR